MLKLDQLMIAFELVWVMSRVEPERLIEACPLATLPPVGNVVDATWAKATAGVVSRVEASRATLSRLCG